jgi:hypothetical protein
MKKIKLRCIYCKKIINTKKDNYGWHYSKDGFIEKCYFSIFPMKYTIKINNKQK